MFHEYESDLCIDDAGRRYVDFNLPQLVPHNTLLLSPFKITTLLESHTSILVFLNPIAFQIG